MTHHLLAIGVNRSTDPNIQPLQFAEADAREFHRFCKEELGYGDNAELLVDAPSFRPHVRNAVEVIGRRIRAGDTFLLYFSGHGYVVNGEPYGLLSQAELLPLERGRTDSNDLLSIRGLREAIRDAWPKGVHFACVMDACRTEIKVGTKGGAALSEMRKHLEGYASKGGFKVGGRRGQGGEPEGAPDVGDIELYACPLGAQSHEFEPIGRGMVSYVLQNWLREGLQRGEPRVLDESLADVLEAGVDELAREYRRASPGQRPVIQRNGAPVLLFSPQGRGGVVQLTRSQQEALEQFDGQLGSGHLDEPWNHCARDTLNRLCALNVSVALQKELSERLQQARAEARRQDDGHKDAELLQQAREMDSEIGWSTVLFQARLPETKDEARRQLQALKAAKKGKREADTAAQAAEAAEDSAWGLATQLNTEAAYKHVLASFPQGRHADEARSRMAALGREQRRQQEAEAARLKEAQAQAEQMRQEAQQQAEAQARAEKLALADDTAWVRAVAANTEASYATYLEAFPAGRHVGRAKAAVSGLQAERKLEQERAQENARLEQQRQEAERAKASDDKAWARAQSLNSVAGYEAYLKEYAQGGYREQANAVLCELIPAEALQRTRAKAERADADDKAWARARSLNSVAGHEAYLNEYPDGRHVDKAKLALDCCRIAEQAKARSAETPPQRQSDGWAASVFKVFVVPACVVGALALMAHELGVGKKREVAPPAPVSAPAPEPVLAGQAQPSTEAIGADYLRNRIALLESAWWAASHIAEPSAAPAELASVLQQAKALAGGWGEAALDYGQALAYGHGAPRDEAAGTVLLLKALQSGAAGAGSEGQARAMEAIDHAMAQAVSQGPQPGWAAALSQLNARLTVTMPGDYWKGVMQRCLVPGGDARVAAAALERAQATPASVPNSEAYRQLASSHLRCLRQGQGCGAACKE